ncbi:ligase-associated DNA damage response endonuclease PdeM [Stenotrophomonas chelatiphaga]|uniref:ligase-associated DNA damage response endonuclease PdeM n=1 Tax=Stenotrophomonas chelatiphaga TaxID=517011 RepID=UPI00289C7FF2|nr:ligase-associated DNA damage response endonuclease PdeM [Stenotrophomonas chelatiphaga]
MPDDVVLHLAGEEVILLGERALRIPRLRAVLIADLHLGKADIFRRAGIALPVGGTAADLKRLQQLVERADCEQLWILGDVLHGPLHRAPWYSHWLAWREQRPGLAVHVVRGNHDRALSPAALQVQVHEEQAALGPFLLRHEPEPDAQAHVIGGHLHPLAALPGLPRRLPAFWLRERVTVLPAFSQFTAGVVPVLAAGERMVACVDTAAVLLPAR